MIASKNLKKQIILEVGALLLLVCVILYAVFAIQKNNQNKVNTIDGFVTVLDDSKFDTLEVLSDGKGLETPGLTYTVTNNNKEDTTYKIVIVPGTTDEKILKQIKVSVDDIYVSSLASLEKYEDGYVITTNELKQGYTKIHAIKLWYKIKTTDDISKNQVDFTYRLINTNKI